MGYANYIGRVGALAVTLGVGVAIANAPAVAFADTSSSSSESSSSSSESSSSSDKPASSTESSVSAASSAAEDPTSTEQSDADLSDITNDDDAIDEEATVEDVAEEAEDDADTSLTDEEPAQEPAQEEALSDDVGAADPPASSSHKSRSGSRDFADEVKSYVSATVERFTRAQEEPQTQSDVTATAKVTATEDIAPKASTTPANPTTTFTTMTVPESAPVAGPTQPPPTLVSLVTETVASVLRPLMGLGTEAPLQLPGLWAMLAAARGEFEQGQSQQSTPPAAQYTVTQVSGPSAQANGTPYVLVIGVDGTNLGRILSDPENDHFFALMDEGTTAASSIVGHTTISNPSWTAILTGVWGETTGVVNNVFTPGPYNRYPTVFNMLETHDPNIETVAIANWNVIADIANAGSIPADQIHFVPQVPGDTNWLLTDDAVGAATVAAIQNTQTGTPTFMFTYFVGVDENGHEYGGASPQYAEAIRNVDENIGAIMAEIAEREKCNPGLCENWTVIVVTDHGHQPQQGFGHGFQTPSETSTFVIARGSDFQQGFMNLQYEIIDTTPTVLDLFGAPPPAYSDGVSLTTLGDSDADPVDLHQALFDAIAMNGYPDIGTDIALGIRTIFTSIPYFVYTFTYDTIDQLRAIADQDIFLVSALAGLAIVPVQLVGNLLYVATNIPAQIVARLTGVNNNSIFPLIPAPPSTWPPSPLIPPNLALLTCGEAATAEAPCSTAIVA